MKLSMNPISNIHDGFGVMHKSIQRSLEAEGVEIVPLGQSQFNLSFAHPHSGRFGDGYDILYCPWESTEPQPGWHKYLAMADEVWATSPWVASVFASWGYPAKVYEHGYNPLFTPKKRTVDKMIFLFQGFEAFRKGGHIILPAFRKAFNYSNDVELWIKTKTTDLSGVRLPNVKFIDDDLTLGEMVDLYHQAHIMVAPTYGEGFGLPSRDAMLTGMPLIHTAGFAPYEQFMNKNLVLDSKLIDSPWPIPHPGQMYLPDIDHLVDLLREVRDNYDLYHEDALRKVPELQSYYDWSNLTRTAFSDLL